MPKPLSMEALDSDALLYLKVEARGRELLDLHGLQDWRFELSASKDRLGVCKHAEKLIEHSQYYLHVPWSEIEDTILHEIAHALVGTKHGHDHVWKQKCIEIGARPQRLAPPYKSSAKPNYVIKCQGCGRQWKRYRLRKSLLKPSAHCGACGGAIKCYKIERK